MFEMTSTSLKGLFFKKKKSMTEKIGAKLVRKRKKTQHDILFPFTGHNEHVKSLWYTISRCFNTKRVW